MEMKRIFSSHINRVGYDPQSEELHVEFDSGKTAVYSGVPSQVGIAVRDAPSVGEALHKMVKGQFAFGYKSGK